MSPMRQPPEPLHIRTGAHPIEVLFALLHRPAGPVRGLVLYVHPFAEEMNKSRRMAALQCTDLSSAGFLVLQPDLFGCGDSPGMLEEATWDRWVMDIIACAQWLMRQVQHGDLDTSTPSSVPLWLWGVRLGALLAAEAARQENLACHCIFWQPTSTGKAPLQQFLRLRMAADLAAGQHKGVTAALKADLDSGRSVHVAGYELPAAVASGMEAATLAPPSPSSNAQLVWFELSAKADAELSPAAAAPLARWKEAGWTVHAQPVQGPQFWQTTEIEVAPTLLALTCQALIERSGSAAVNVPNRSPHLPALDDDARCDADIAAAQPSGVLIACADEQLVGVLHRSPTPRASGEIGVLIVVGGPQYRVGSHRQFVHLARAVAAVGHPVLRFDVRGMGDGSGASRSFEQLDDDIRCAVDQFQRDCPEVRRVVLWGLCDGASASLLHWHRTRDPRIAALAMANPWVRSVNTEARTLVRHYYIDRLRQRSFWVKLLSGGVALTAARALVGNLRAGFSRRTAKPTVSGIPFTQQMAAAWREFPGALLLLVSGQDYTAQEFLGACDTEPEWQGALSRSGLTRVDLIDADHTFSGPGQKAAVGDATVRWLATVATP